MSFDIGRSRVHLQTLDFDLPAAREGNYTTEILDLLPHSENLNPDKSINVEDLKTALSIIVNRKHTAPPSVLAQCNLTLLLCRRLRTLNFHFQGTLLSQVLCVTAAGIQAAQTLLDDCAPWHHVVNVPFQVICILLALDTPAAIAQLADGVKTLSNIQMIYNTDAAKEALSTACLLIHLHRKRKEVDLKTLSGIVATYSPLVLLSPEQQQQQQQQQHPQQFASTCQPQQNVVEWSSGSTRLDNFAELPDLQTFDIDCFLNGSSEWGIPNDFWTQAL
jgi:hypothetical protein